MDLFDRAEEVSGRFSSLLSSHAERVTKGIINTILLMVILAVFGCFDFMSLTFDFSVFDFVNHTAKAVAFWTRVVTKTIAGVCSYKIGMNIMWDWEIRKASVLKGLIGEYEELLKTKDAVTFNYFVEHVFNIREKKLAWLDKVSRKIYWLNKFARHKDLILYTNGSQEERQKSKYCQKRADLETMKSDDWVEKNINSVYVKYTPIDPIVFDLDIDAKTTKRGAKVKGNIGLAQAKSMSNVVVGMVGISMITASIALSADGQQFADQMQAFWFYFLSAMEDLGVVCWQAFRGMMEDKKIINSEYVEPYANRVKVLKEYNNWCLENRVQKSKAYRIFQALEEETKEA